MPGLQCCSIWAVVFLLAAELSGKIQPADLVIRVNANTTNGLGYAAVLDLIVAAPRPVTIHFERRAGGGKHEAASRVQHVEWKGDGETVGPYSVLYIEPSETHYHRYSIPPAVGRQL